MEYPDVPSNSPSPSPTPRGGGGGGGTGSGGDSPTQIPSRPASPELPLTMTASAILTSLPRDASSALASASRPSASAAPSAGTGTGTPDPEPDRKVVVRFKAVGGGAPRLRRDLRKIGATQRFEAVVVHLRRALRLADTQGLFCYVNSAFAPALDEVVGNLHQCFKDSNDQLIIAYSITPAFG